MHVLFALVYLLSSLPLPPFSLFFFCPKYPNPTVHVRRRLISSLYPSCLLFRLSCNHLVIYATVNEAHRSPLSAENPHVGVSVDRSPQAANLVSCGRVVPCPCRSRPFVPSAPILLAIHPINHASLRRVTSHCHEVPFHLFSSFERTLVVSPSSCLISARHVRLEFLRCYHIHIVPCFGCNHFTILGFDRR